MRMQPADPNRRTLLAAATALACLPAVAAAQNRMSGHYTDRTLAVINGFTLPRTCLYDAKGGLVPRADWPNELSKVKDEAGDAFCCVSDKPAPPGSLAPPPDCKIVVYGTDVRENFIGLLGPTGKPIAYDGLPRSRFLLVEYFATWCPPCVVGRRKLEQLFSSPNESKDYPWVSIDLTRMLEAQKPAKPRAQ